MAVDNASFRKTMGNFASSVCVVTTTQDQESHGVTISSFASLSLSPAMILFCLGKNSAKYPYFAKADLVAITILSNEQANMSENFSRNHENYWENIDLIKGDQTGLPVIKGAIAYVEAEIENRYDGGDHIIFTAQVINCVTLSDLSPLIHFRSSYRQIG